MVHPDRVILELASVRARFAEDLCAGLDWRSQALVEAFASRLCDSFPRRELDPRIGKEQAMSSPSDADVIGRSLSEPEAFGRIYDRHAATLLRFLGRRVGAEVAEGLVGELFRIAFERRKSFDGTRPSALPWLYGIGSNLLLKHQRSEARRLLSLRPHLFFPAGLEEFAQARPGAAES